MAILPLILAGVVIYAVNGSIKQWTANLEAQNKALQEQRKADRDAAASEVR